MKGNQNLLQNAYGAKDIQSFNMASDAIRQSASTALGTHGLSSTTKVVGLRNQYKSSDQ